MLRLMSNPLMPRSRDDDKVAPMSWDLKRPDSPTESKETLRKIMDSTVTCAEDYTFDPILRQEASSIDELLSQAQNLLKADNAVAVLDQSNVSAPYSVQNSEAMLDFGQEMPLQQQQQSTKSETNRACILEPTPIGFNGINIVDSVELAEVSWLEDKTYFACLHPLLVGDSRIIENSLSPYIDMDLKLGIDYPTELSDLNDTADDSSDLAFRPRQLEQWNIRYQDLVEFHRKHKHCLVPLNWPENPSLAHWIKRQRYQYSLKMEGKHSTLTDEREIILAKLGFVWDSHAAVWEERWNELKEFQKRHGHCNVPTRYAENSKLAIWVKCQRRQFKLLLAGHRSNMTQDRIEKLIELGFVFDPRLKKKSYKIFER